jgi:hypothetical protein
MSAADRPDVTAGGLEARPAAEGREQRLEGFGRKPLLGQAPEKADRLTKVFQVRPAGLALREVRVEPSPIEEESQP